MKEQYFDKLKSLSPEEQQLFLKAKELELKETELEHKKKSDANKNWWQNPVYLAAFGLLGNIVVSYFNSCNQQKIERDKVNSAAIIEAIKTGDTGTAKGNIKFLLGIKFLNDKDGTIKKYLDSTTNLPVLPPASPGYSEDEHSYIAVDTIPSSSPLGRLSACVGLLKFYNKNTVAMVSTAVAYDETKIAFPKILAGDIENYSRITFTLDYNEANKSGKEVEVKIDKGNANTNEDFEYFSVAANYKFSAHISQFQIVSPVAAQEILIIQHPEGKAKRIAKNKSCKILTVEQGENKFTYSCQTKAGSAGGLIITKDYKMIGIHVGRNQDGSKFGIAFNPKK